MNRNHANRPTRLSHAERVRKAPVVTWSLTLGQVIKIMCGFSLMVVAVKTFCT